MQLSEGLFAAFPVTVSTADRFAAADGRKLTLILQLLHSIDQWRTGPDPTLKSAALLPLMVNPEMVRFWLPVSEMEERQACWWFPLSAHRQN